MLEIHRIDVALERGLELMAVSRELVDRCVLLRGWRDPALAARLLSEVEALDRGEPVGPFLAHELAGVPSQEVQRTVRMIEREVVEQSSYVTAVDRVRGERCAALMHAAMDESVSVEDLAEWPLIEGRPRWPVIDEMVELSD
jgi:hypothetical protein